MKHALTTQQYLPACFCPDGYFGQHNRHMFAASKWLADLIDAEADWPLAATIMAEHLRSENYSPDHIEEQLARARDLIVPWLIELKTQNKVTQTYGAAI